MIFSAISESDRIYTEGDMHNTLVIKDLKYDDRNEYICIGKSEYDGEIHLTTLVRVKSE